MTQIPLSSNQSEGTNTHIKQQIKGHKYKCQAFIQKTNKSNWSTLQKTQLPLSSSQLEDTNINVKQPIRGHKYEFQVSNQKTIPDLATNQRTQIPLSIN